MKHSLRNKLFYKIFPYALIIILLIAVVFVLFKFKGNKEVSEILNIKSIFNIQQKTSNIKEENLEAPVEFTESKFEEGEGVVTLVRSKEQKYSFQIYSLDLNEPDVTLTLNKIRQDIPGMEIKNGKEIQIQNLPAVSFESEGKKEIWLIYNGKLYQASSYLDSQEFMEKVLKIWKFYQPPPNTTPM